MPPHCPRNRHVRRTKTRKTKALHVSHKHGLVDGVCQCYVLGFSGRNCSALLCPRKQAYACTCANHSPIGNRPPVSDLASIIGIRKCFQLKSTAPLKNNAKISRRNSLFQNTNRSPPVYLPGRIRVSSFRSYHVSDVRLVLVRKPHQARHQLAKGPDVLGLVRVGLLELQTGWEWGSSTKANTKHCCRSVFGESMLRIVKAPASKTLIKRQPAYHLNSPRLLTATSRFRSSQN